MYMFLLSIFNTYYIKKQVQARMVIAYISRAVLARLMSYSMTRQTADKYSIIHIQKNTSVSYREIIISQLIIKNKF